MDNKKQNKKNQLLPVQLTRNNIAFEKVYLDIDIDFTGVYIFVYTLLCLKSNYLDYPIVDVAAFRDVRKAYAYVDTINEIIAFQKRNKDYEKIREKMSESIKNFKYRRIL
ncbi:MAG TPA: hypothetical protein IAC63_03105 [Candidatus Enterousia avicola]|uniref:Uncharacterized protein n=1 Tax=Candidatus Enterousia avicola TaxID=2840787 RepID=A0A9D1SN04_9PROT|nr:hypothetical protein [Candidatus Enterousia avicola]